MFTTLKLAFKYHFLKKKLRNSNTYFNLKNINYQNKNVLIIDSIIPEYNKDSGSRRLLEIIKLLLKNKVGVFLMADKKEYRYKKEYIKTYEDLGVIVYQPSIDSDNKLITKHIFIKTIAPNLHYAWLHRPDVFMKYHAIIKKTNKNCQLIYDMVDFHYLRLIRQWEQHKIKKFKIDAEKHLKMEVENCRKADQIILISENDKKYLRNYYNQESKMVVIGNVHKFLQKPKTFKTFTNRKQLLFVGGFKHLPNIDAVLFCHNEVMPLVWEQDPSIELIIVGSHPTPEILELHSGKIIIKGFVDDISKFFSDAKLFIAPLRYGAGIKGKIGQSFEHSLPVVTTEVGAEGFNFSPYSIDMIANSAEGLASNIIKLYEDEKLWNAISDHSDKIIAPFSISHIESQLETVLQLKH